MTSNSLTAEQVKERAETLDFPSSVVEFFQGYLGQPYGGFPEPLRTHIIRNKPRVDGRPGASMQPMDFKKIKADLRAKFGKHITDVDVMSYAMYPKVFEEYQGFVEKYGDLSIIPTRYFLGRPDIGEEMNISIEKGKMLIIRLMAIGAVTEGKGTRDVWFEVNGEVRAVPVEDKSAAVDTISRERATSDPGSVGAPMSGVVVEVRVKEGQEVKKGDILCVQSAMKVKRAISSLSKDQADSPIDGECRVRPCIWTCQARCCTRRRLIEPRRFTGGDCPLNLYHSRPLELKSKLFNLSNSAW
jgi:pyruvate carboxylase